jgi:DNA helicase INO80
MNSKHTDSFPWQRRRTYLLDTMSRAFIARVAGASDRFNGQYEAAAQGEVHEKEIQDEKERKKDMQRKRRREQAIKAETLKMEEAEEKAKNAPD